MADIGTWMIYGANGFTGRLVANEATRRGLRPILAGRRAPPIEVLARDLGLPSRVFDVNDRSDMVAALRDVDAVANCAGPFTATSRPMLDACLEATTHYLDITGEIDVFVDAERRHSAAREAGIVICPGVGFDVVPTDCVAAVLKQALPDATDLALGFDLNSTPSPGTAKTMVEGLRSGGRVRRDGEIVAVPFGYRTRSIDFGDGPCLCVTIPWGDVATAYFSTRIPNIEVYVRASAATVFAMRRLNGLRPILGVPGVAAMLRRLAARSGGPSGPQLREDIGHVWGEVRNAQGARRTARLTTPNGYRLTADSTIMATIHVLTQRPAGGYYTPSGLMGPRCVERLAGASEIHVR